MNIPILPRPALAIVTILSPTPTHRSARENPYFVCRSSKNFPRPDRDDAPDDSSPDYGKPLSPLEKTLYTIFAVWAGLTLIALFVLVLILHSPVVGN